MGTRRGMVVRVVGGGIGLLILSSEGIAQVRIGPSFWESIQEADVIVLGRVIPPEPVPPAPSLDSGAVDRMVEDFAGDDDGDLQDGLDGSESDEESKSESDAEQGGSDEGRVVVLEPGSAANLRFAVQETWKGTRLATVLSWHPSDVDWSRICPAGRVVIAFLKEEDGRLTPLTCVYGDAAVEPDADEIESLGRLIRSAVSLQGRDWPSDRDRVDWLVAEAAIPLLRRNALYELYPPADRLNFMSEPVMRVPLAPLLTPSQMDRLETMFVKSGQTDVTLPLFLAILADHPSTQVDDAAVALIDKALDGGESGWVVSDAIGFVLDRFGDPARRERVRTFLGRFAMPTPDQVRALWKSAMRDMIVPQAPAAPGP